MYFLNVKLLIFYCYYIDIKLIIIDLLKSLSSNSLFFVFVFVFLYILLDFLYRWSCHLWLKSASLLPIQYGYLFFPFFGVWRLSQLKQETKAIVRLNLFASYTSVTSILLGLILSSLKIILIYMYIYVNMCVYVCIYIYI